MWGGVVTIIDIRIYLNGLVHKISHMLGRKDRQGFYFIIVIIIFIVKTNK